MHLVRSPLSARFADDGVFAPAAPTGAIHPRATPALGLTSDGASISPRATVEVHGGGGAPLAVSAAFSLYLPGGATPLATSITASGSGVAGDTLTLAPPPFAVTVPAELWSVPRPFLYTLVASLYDGSLALLDVVNVTLGVRSVAFAEGSGASLNGQPLKLRGFCNHASFTAVGMGVPPRINLLRMQQMRGMGSNSWRMSHNPGSPATFALGDRLGMTFLDENRVFNSDPSSVTNMGDMVRRDRSHASILWWSYCNEAGCSPQLEPAASFYAITQQVDGTRPQTMNYFAGDILPNPQGSVSVVDVQGLSHPSAANAESMHAAFPKKPLAATECCSCLNQRDEDEDQALPPNSTVTYRSNTGGCQASQTNVSTSRDWMAGQCECAGTGRGPFA